MEYLERVADIELKERLEAIGAVYIKGPKWCGKSTTAGQQAKSTIFLQDPDKRAEYLATGMITPSVLVRGERVRVARYLLTQVQSVTLAVGGRCRTVGCQQHLVARVLTALARLCQCAGYAIDTGRENYICHFVFGVCRTALALALALAVRTSTP